MSYTPPMFATAPRVIASHDGNDVDNNPETHVQAKSEEAGTGKFNDFNGRDPDLLAVGEQIKLNDSDKPYTVKAGDTLSSIAEKEGADFDSLMKTNGFDQQLLGQNSNGAYFSESASQQLVATPVDMPNIQPTDVPKIKSAIEQSVSDGEISEDEGKDLEKLADKYAKEGLTSAELPRLKPYAGT